MEEANNTISVNKIDVSLNLHAVLAFFQSKIECFHLVFEQNIKLHPLFLDPKNASD